MYKLYILFYNKENVGDVLIIKGSDKVATSYKKYNDLVNKFIKEHKSYHLTVSDKDFFDTFFDNFWLF